MTSSANTALSVRPATSSDQSALETMFKAFVRDMWQANQETLLNTSQGEISQPELERFVTKEITESRMLIAFLDDRPVGFLDARYLPEFNGVFISLAFVSPKYRQKGIGTALYRSAIDDMGAQGIYLVYRRVQKRVNYWRSLGFQSIIFRSPQALGYGKICYLSTQEFPSPLSCELDARAISQFRKRLAQFQLNNRSFIQESNSEGSALRSALRRACDDN